MENNLVPPFMMRLAQIEINEEPKVLATNPTPVHHSMYCLRTDVRIHFSLKGIVSYIPTRRPTQDKFNQILTRIKLTPPNPSWNPHNVRYADQEAHMLDHHGHLVKQDRRKMEVDNSASIFADEVNSVLLSLSPAIESWSLATALNAL